MGAKSKRSGTAFNAAFESAGRVPAHAKTHFGLQLSPSGPSLPLLPLPTPRGAIPPLNCRNPVEEKKREKGLSSGRSWRVLRRKRETTRKWLSIRLPAGSLGVRRSAECVVTQQSYFSPISDNSLHNYYFEIHTMKGLIWICITFLRWMLYYTVFMVSSVLSFWNNTILSR